MKKGPVELCFSDKVATSSTIRDSAAVAVKDT
jgi:hypothetical protein